MESPHPRWVRILPVALVVVVLGGLAAAHPTLRFVDFLSFSNRARRLAQGQDWVNGLYPVGYPALLLGARLALGDVLVAGKLLSVLAGVIAAWSASRLTHPAAVMVMAATGVFLTWGSSEGTDMMAAALALAALARADSPALAGALAGGACLTRYTGFAVLPALLLITPRRGAALLAFCAATAPHWATALVLHLPVLPDQSSNMAIGAGPGAPQGGLARWAAGAARAMVDSFGALLPGVGLLGLIVGAVRRHKPALGLLALALTHVAGLGLAFSNPRLALPATLAATLGWCWLLPERRRPWLALAGLGLLAALPGQARVDAEERALAEISAVAAPEPVLSTSPLYHQRSAGWLQSGVILRSLGGDPRRLDPSTLASAARRRGFRAVAIEAGRVSATWPGLKPLARGPAPDGYTLLAETGSWRLFQFDHASVAPSSSPSPSL